MSGAAGKTGLAVTRACTARGLAVTALVRRAEQRPAALAAGAARAVVVDLGDPARVRAALDGHHAMYHVAPNMHPDEVGLTRIAVTAAQQCGARRFVLHSVLAPYLPDMPHHLRKADSERVLRGSGLDWTILQPASYAQNVAVELVRRTGVLTVPYRTTAPFTPVDLADVAEAAAVVLTEAGHTHASYELCGPAVLDTVAMAACLSAVLGRDVQAGAQSAEDWSATVPELDARTRQDLLAMFDYYDRHGLVGNPRVLSGLLGRAPTTFGEALAASPTSTALARG
ncbi:NAD(P)H-binding protein [Rhodococcus sp. X156]|uniref:SDR family oxidoreductase n=1 Tax=Rhodococcus sp. X156 TaxID=2499145 RepID=UPI0013E33B26|nr:NAD(P)H-binding protein [Rhodococcus sp. X156]